MPEPVVDLRGVSRRYGADPPVDALRGVDLVVNEGEWVAVVGPSGSGKSTLLHVLGCLDRPTAGTYRFRGIDTARLSDRRRAGLRSRGIGFVFQAFHLLPHRTVLENVMLSEAYSKHSRKGRQERAEAALEKVGLAHRAHFLPTKLSGGERQRVAIARALLAEPEVLLCDEPTGNLDSKTTDSLLELLETLHGNGLTIVVITHDPHVAERAERIVHIVDGRLEEPAAKTRPAETAGAEEEEEDAATVLPAGMSTRDLGNEALSGLLARPGRMALTVLGTVIGLTALVATLGLSRTASNRIIGRFDALQATEIVVSSQEPTLSGGPVALPWDAPERLRRLDGVVEAGLLSEVDVGDALVSTSPISDPQRRTDLKLTIQTASPELFDIVRAEVRTGRLSDEGHSTRGDRVAVLGPNAAERLGITGIEALPAISIGDDLFSVVGILDGVSRQHQLLASVLIPTGTAQQIYGLRDPEFVVIETRIGAAKLIARQAPLALRPDNPTGLQVAAPPEQQRVREAVQSDLNILFLMLGAVSLVVGAIGIANVTLVGVMERTGEIGLRRALGARRVYIAWQFLLESGTMGLIGGILGASVGALVVVLVSAVQEWTPVLDPIVPFGAVAVGMVTGLLSGAYPAMRAARMEPVEALRVGA